MTDRGFTLSTGGALKQIDKIDGRYVFCHPAARDVIDERCDENTLVGALRKLKSDLPDQRTITVQCEDGVQYSDLVKVIDACNLTDPNNLPVLFPEVSVSAVI